MQFDEEYILYQDNLDYGQFRDNSSEYNLHSEFKEIESKNEHSNAIQKQYEYFYGPMYNENNSDQTSKSDIEYKIEKYNYTMDIINDVLDNTYELINNILEW